MDGAADVLRSFGESLPGFNALIVVCAYLFGIVLSGVGVYSLVTAGRDGRSSRGNGIAGILFGGLLLSLPYFMQVGSNTLFGESAQLRDLSGNSSLGGASAPNIIVSVVLNFVVVLGWFAASWALYMFYLSSKPGQDGSTLRRNGFIFLVGGIMCANIEATIRAIGETFGISGIVTTILG